MEILAELLPFALAAVAGLAGWAVGRLDKYVKGTKTTIDDELLEALRTAFAPVDANKNEDK